MLVVGYIFLHDVVVVVPKTKFLPALAALNEMVNFGMDKPLKDRTPAYMSLCMCTLHLYFIDSNPKISPSGYIIMHG